ncbi:hypothetical protein D5125_03405 [Magnetovirga frankeli]|uniref:LPD23 domain-containing protein n=1 Tax=Magnetovirga frankeli TaxID=947516 RepID=UPI0012938923|nr:hypothetical protein D5125_03405 [gamma proteobacterium SS-5]
MKWSLRDDIDLLGDSETAVAKRQALADREREKDAARNGLNQDAPGPAGFNLTGSNAERDQLAAAWQRELPFSNAQINADAQSNAQSNQRKTEYVDWFVNYTEQEGKGRTTETKRFGTLKEAKAFAQGKYGYITRASDGGSDWNAGTAETRFVEFFGGFEPTAQEQNKIDSLVSKPGAARDQLAAAWQREIFEPDGLYSTNDRDNSRLQVESQRGATATPTQLAFDLRPAAAVPTARAQSRDNFYVEYHQVPVGEVAVAFDRIDSAAKAAHVMAFLRKKAQEFFYALVTDDAGKILSLQLHTKGGRDFSAVPYEVVGPAIAAVEGGTKVWFGHNHPSGNMAPSQADVTATNALNRFLEGSGVAVQGHVVVALGSNSAVHLAADGSPLGTVPIAPGARKNRVAVTELAIRKHPPKDREFITTPQAAKRVAEGLSSEDALVLLDTRHGVVGVISLTPKEMSALRQDGQVRRVLQGISKTNASAGIIKSSDAEAAKNLAKFLNHAKKLRLLDVLLSGEPGATPGELRSSVQRETQYGDLHNAAGPWLSRNPTKAQGTTLAGIKQAFANQFPNLSKALDKMLARGEQGLRGGAVFVQKADDLAAEFAAKTGRTLEQARAALKFSRDSVVPWPEDFPPAVVNTTNTKVTTHPDFKKAKAGDLDAARRLVRDLVKPERIKALAQKFPDAIVVPVVEVESSGTNAIPLALAELLSDAGLKIDRNIKQTSSGKRKNLNAAQRLLERKRFAGKVVKGGKYILVDDVLTQGGTAHELRHHLANSGGDAVAVLSLSFSAGSNIIAVKPGTLAALRDQFNVSELENVLYQYNIAGKIEALTESEARALLRYGSIDSLRARLANENARKLDTGNEGKESEHQVRVKLSQNGNIQGLFDPQSGLTFLVGENLDADTANGVILHEVTHSAQRDSVNQAAARLLNTADRQGQKLKNLLAQVKARMRSAGALDKDGNIIDIDEAPAYIVELAANQGRQEGYSAVDGRFMDWVDKTFGKRLGKIIRDYVAVVRAGLRRLGAPVRLSVDDILAMVQHDMKQAAEGRVREGGEVVSGSFAGPNAKTANAQTLDNAQQMLADGADGPTIWKATGWYQDEDGMWRSEIDDNAAVFNNPYPEQVELANELREAGADLAKHRAATLCFPRLINLAEGKVL